MKQKGEGLIFLNATAVQNLKEIWGFCAGFPPLDSMWAFLSLAVEGLEKPFLESKRMIWERQRERECARELILDWYPAYLIFYWKGVKEDCFESYTLCIFESLEGLIYWKFSLSFNSYWMVASAAHSRHFTDWVNENFELEGNFRDGYWSFPQLKHIKICFTQQSVLACIPRNFWWLYFLSISSAVLVLLRMVLGSSGLLWFGEEQMKSLECGPCFAFSAWV